jgi:hypothetical protein
MIEISANKTKAIINASRFLLASGLQELII